MAIRAIIGLGNEGKEYATTYHNVGAFGVSLLQKSEEAAHMKFFKLSGFMNTIGIPAAAFLKKAGVAPAQALVIHDESDLLVGDYKLSFGGGSAGHKGVASVIDNVGSEEFWRLRIGVRDPKEQVRKKADLPRRVKAGEFVLQQWSKADEDAFRSVIEKAWQEMREKKLI